MQLEAKLTSGEIDAIVRALEEDINAGEIAVSIRKGPEGKSYHNLNTNYTRSAKCPAIQRAVEAILNNAFKEGCKCGKGGYSQY